jgi:peptidoglycan/LPS O-acetylase OafA/YrhL
VTAAAPAPARRRKPIDDERPPAPWGSFPLVEIVVLIALAMLVAALIVDGTRSTALLVTGLALGSLAGLELSIREHFSGYRSHTALLAGAAGVAALAVLFYVVPGLLPPAARLAVGAAVTAAAAVALARAFRARSGRLVKLR